MHRNFRVTALLGAALASYGCSDATGPLDLSTNRPSTEAVASRTLAEQEAVLQQVVRGVAIALNDERVRLAVRDAMRDSPWNEHKLIFQEFITTTAGAGLVDAAGAAAGLSRAEFLANVAKLPSLDFYFVHGTQRRTWRGTPGVVVGATLNSDNGTHYRFDSRGAAVAAPGRAGAPGYPLVALIPAESKAVRQNPQPKGQGNVIEAENDGQRAESFKWIEPNGTVLTANLTDIRAGRDPRFTVLMNSSATAGTRLDCIVSTIRDGGEFAGNVELEVYAKFYGPDGAQLGTGVYKNHEFPEAPRDGSVTRCPAVTLVTRVIPEQSTAKINLELWEDDCDCWGNGDDFYGRRDFFWNDRAQYRDVGNDGNMLEIDWDPIPPSVVSSVSVSGITMYTGGTAYAYAKPIDQYGYGLPAQHVSSWWSSDSYIADVDGGGTVTANAQGSTAIYATVAGITGTGSVTVETMGGGDCGSRIICERY